MKFDETEGHPEDEYFLKKKITRLKKSTMRKWFLQEQKPFEAPHKNSRLVEWHGGPLDVNPPQEKQRSKPLWHSVNWFKRAPIPFICSPATQTVTLKPAKKIKTTTVLATAQLDCSSICWTRTFRPNSANTRLTLPCAVRKPANYPWSTQNWPLCMGLTGHWNQFGYMHLYAGFGTETRWLDHFLKGTYVLIRGWGPLLILQLHFQTFFVVHQNQHFRES